MQELARDSQPLVPTTVESLAREAQTCSTQARLELLCKQRAGKEEKSVTPDYGLWTSVLLFKVPPAVSQRIEADI